MQNEITIGADPEFFIWDNVHNKIGSVIGKLGGTKDEPLKTRHGYVQEDNVLGEINIPPAKDADNFMESILSVMSDAGEILEANDCSIAAGPMFHKFSDDDAELFLESPEARTFGCDPDFNAWTMESNPNPSDAANSMNVRVAGGHIHIGIPEKYKNPMTTIYLTKLCDALITFPMLRKAGDIYKEQEELRREFYGMAGSHRIKRYGIEYRSVSNCWLWSRQLINYVYQAAYLAAETVCRNNPRIEHDINRLYEYELMNYINQPAVMKGSGTEDMCNEYIKDRFPLPAIRLEYFRTASPDTPAYNLRMAFKKPKKKKAESKEAGLI